jgi:hypothetical protein
LCDAVRWAAAAPSNVGTSSPVGVDRPRWGWRYRPVEYPAATEAASTPTRPVTGRTGRWRRPVPEMTSETHKRRYLPGGVAVSAITDHFGADAQAPGVHLASPNPPAKLRTYTTSRCECLPIRSGSVHRSSARQAATRGGPDFSACWRRRIDMPIRPYSSMKRRQVSSSWVRTGAPALEPIAEGRSRSVSRSTLRVRASAT